MVVYDTRKFTENGETRFCLVCYRSSYSTHNIPCFDDIRENRYLHCNALDENPLVGRLCVSTLLPILPSEFTFVTPRGVLYTEPCFSITSILNADAWGGEMLHLYGIIKNSELGKQFSEYLNRECSMQLEIEVERVINRPYKYELKRARAIVD